MKTSRFIAIVWTTLTLCCVGAQAQDRDANPGSVDASVHQGVEEQAQPEPSTNAIKAPVPFSRWSSQPAKATPSAAAWSTRMIRANALETTEDNKPAPVAGGNLVKQLGSMPWLAHGCALDGPGKDLHSRPGSFAILPAQHRASTFSSPILPSPTESQGFPRPFGQKHSDRLFDSFPTTLTGGKEAKAKRFKSSAAKSERLETGNVKDSATSGKP
jgi:hypothetical protein